MSYFNRKARKKAKKPKLLPRTSIEDTKKLFLRADTKPIEIGVIFDGGFKDNHYRKTFMEQAQEAEHELFFDEGVQKSKKANLDLEKRSEQKSDLVDAEFDKEVQKKIDKVLVAFCLVWDDKQYSENIKKLEYLVGANADINTEQGVGLIRHTLLARMLYEDEKKQKLQQALINFADLHSLEPKERKARLAVVNTPFSIVTSRYKFDLMRLMLERNCEPNRIASNGMTPLILICRYNARLSKDENNYKRLKCLELLVNFEGPDAKKLKIKWAKIFDEIYPEGGEKVWLTIASFCIPNINVQPTFKDRNAEEWLRMHDNPTLFCKEGLKLVEGLSVDAITQNETYWPKNREDYIKMFNPHWLE